MAIQMWREKGITAGVYRNQQQGLISASSDGTTWLTISDKNLGASVPYNYGDTMSDANCGLYYQRGNNYGFGWGTISIYNSQVNTTGYSRQNPYSSSDYYWDSKPDWSNPSNPELRGSTTGTNQSRRGPCPLGYHVPTIAEIENLIDLADLLAGGTMDASTFRQIFKIPLSGGRIDNPDQPAYLNQRSYLWTSSSSITDTSSAGYLFIYSNGNRGVNTFGRKASGYPVRAFKNDVVIPDGSSNRVVLYQPQS